MTQHEISQHEISVVIPVYRGATTLPGLIAELRSVVEPFTTSDGHTARVSEVLLVHDCGPDGSDDVIRELAAEHEFVQPVWLSRNFGQHSATLAGMASAGGDWVATVDEDGQHDPAYLGAMLDRALADDADLVYADPTNKPPHGPLRNLASWGAKRLVSALSGGHGAEQYHSYRLMLGVIARSVAAYSGPGVYLDVALGWLTQRVTTCPVELREEGGRPSGYRLRTLMSHFWRMVLTSGTRLLRLVSIMGAVVAGIGFVLALVLVVLRLAGSTEVAGWTSVMVIVLVTTGMVLFALGVIAEYVGVAVNMALGKPNYLIVGDRAAGPHGAARALAKARDAQLDES